MSFNLKSANTWFHIGAWVSGAMMAFPVLQTTVEFLMVGFFAEALFVFAIGGLVTIALACCFGAVAWALAACCGARTGSVEYYVEQPRTTFLADPDQHHNTTVILPGPSNHHTHHTTTYLVTEPAPVVRSNSFENCFASSPQRPSRGQVGRGGGLLGSSVPVTPQDLGGTGVPVAPHYAATRGWGEGRTHTQLGHGLQSQGHHNGHQIGQPGGGLFSRNQAFVPENQPGGPANRR